MIIEGLPEKLVPVREAFEASPDLTRSRLSFQAKVIATNGGQDARVGEFQETRDEVDYLHVDLTQAGESVEGGTSVTILASVVGEVILSVAGESTQFGAVRRSFAEGLCQAFARELEGWAIDLPVTAEVSEFTPWKA